MAIAIDESVATSASRPSDRSGIAGHPRGLTTLFFTEMWERFSYYGMRALLILYMTASLAAGGLNFDTRKAGLIYGIYTFSVYFTTIIGGLLADMIFGAKRAVLYGGIIIACGHFTMVFNSLPTFYGGLFLIILGTGLLKPNVSTMVGDLYDQNDERRDAGFSIFYMGINLGGFIAPLICGYLGQRINWHYGFAAAGVGMTLGLIQYVLSGNRLANIGERRQKKEQREQRERETETGDARKQTLTRDEIKLICVICILFVFSTIFFMALEQAGSSLNLFADRLTRNSIFGWGFPSTWFQSVNSIFIIIFAPVFSWIWLSLGKRQPSSPAKFAIGLFLSGIGFLIVTFASSLTGAGRVGPSWLLMVYLFLTFGELCLSPVGLSTVTKLAPARMVGAMMGVWFLSIAFGNLLAGLVSGFFRADSETALVRMFGLVTLTTIGAAALLAVLTPAIKRLTPRTN